MQDDSEIERVLAVMAHPDDVDFMAAGSIASWTAKGIEVTYCIVTNGDAGGFDEAIDRSEIAGIRQQEQLNAAAAVGVTDVRFLGHRDGRVEVSLDLRREIATVIREVRPQRLLCQSPERNMVRIPSAHPDHIAVGEATMCAVYPDARNPFCYLEDAAFAALKDWAVPEVLVGGMERVNTYIDVTDFFDAKIAALRNHESQLPPGRDVEAFLRQWLARQATDGGLGEGRLAEAFWLIEIG